MVSGARTIELLGQPKGRPINYTVATDAAIEKGELVRLGPGSRTISGGDFVGFPCAGVAAAEKDVLDTTPTLGINTCGIFDVVLGGAISGGQLVKVSGHNTVVSGMQALDIEKGLTFGRALESGSDGEVIQIAIGIY